MTTRNTRILVMLVCYAIFFSIAFVQKDKKRVFRESALSIQPSREAQIFSAFGDRYLAANVASFRATTIGGVNLDPIAAEVLSRIQVDVAILNPWNEDNYYTAAAVLPWVNKLNASQDVLLRATMARKTDVLPPFYYGFNAQQFEGNFVLASKYAALAATRTPKLGEQNALLDIAAKWGERESTPDLAIKAIESVQSQSRDPGLKGYLEGRKQRVRNLYQLRALARQYELKFGHPLPKVDALVSSGLIDQIPEDPISPGGYVLNKGVIVPRIYLPGGAS